MPIEVDERHLKEGLLGLVVALVEIIQEVLERQAIRRIERGSLKEEEVMRLSEALADLDEALESIKRENGIEETTSSIRDSLDKISDDAIEKFLNPHRWIEKAEKT